MAVKVSIMKWSALLALLHLVLVDNAHGQRILDRCSLAQEMDRLGVAREDLGRWVSIVQRVSDYRTESLSPPGESRHYGLFQVSNIYWCQTTDGPESKNLCNVYCEELLSDNIEASVRCALRIQRMEGWKPWSHVQGHLKIDDCFEAQAGAVRSNGTATGTESMDITESFYPGHNSGVGVEVYKPDIL